MATQRRPDLQESTAKQNSAVCILGVNKFAPKFVTLVATYIYIYIYVVWLLKDLTARHIQGVTGGMDQTSGECSLGQTIPI